MVDKPTKQLQHTDAVYSPGQSAELARQQVLAVKQHPEGITFGLPGPDRDVVPWRPGNLITILGSTSHYKTGLANYIARRALKTCTEPNQVVFKLIWEQSVEEDVLISLAQRSGIGVTQLAMGRINDVQTQMLELAAIEQGATPLWLLGHSTVQQTKQRRIQKPLTLEQASELLEWAINDATGQVLEPKLIVIDYLQIIPSGPEGKWNVEERMKVKDQLGLAKQMALSFNCPVVATSQTSREAYGAPPQMTSGAESSAIEWFSDQVYGSWIPGKTMRGRQLELEGSLWLRDGLPYMVDESTYILRLLKQKQGPAPRTYFLRAEWEANELYELDGQFTRQIAQARRAREQQASFN